MISIPHVRRAIRMRPGRGTACFRLLAVWLGLLMAGQVAIAGNLEKQTYFHIEAQALNRAIVEFATQAHLQLLFEARITRQLRTPGVKGNLTGRQVLADLLKNSNLTFIERGNAIEIVAMSSAASGFSTNVDLRTQRADPAGDSPARVRESRPAAHSSAVPGERSRQLPALQEVVVTGSHISGAPAPSVPVITMTEQDIESSGYQSVEQLMSSLPENFGSVGSEDNLLQSNTNAGNVGYGSTVDLRGLGFDSTLILVNGHRLAPAGVYGAFTDISVIPLSAIKRVDVMTDGASAIYGADAIGGVVNFVLKSRETGAESTAEYGSVTRGGLKDYRAAQSFGTAWSTGSAFVSYEYHKDSALTTLDRAFSESLTPSDLTPEQEQNSIYATAENSISVNSELSASAFYSTRSTHNLSGAPGEIPVQGQAETSQYSYAVSDTTALADRWTVRDRLSYGGDDGRLSDVFGLQAGDDRLATGSVALDGPVFELPAGSVKAAVGADVRYNAMSNLFTGAFSDTPIRKHRTVEAAYAEARAPLAGGTANGARITVLSLDVAARYERYSDFGASTDPMLGLAWQPVRSIRLRSTASSSFRAPNFDELYGTEYSLLVNSADETRPGTLVPALVLYGSNPSLKPEKSFEWTAGMDVTPSKVPGLDIHVTGYEIRFRDRIAAPGFSQISPLAQTSVYAPFIEMNPSYAQLSAWGNLPVQFQNLTVYPGFGPVQTLAEAQAIADDRLQNIGVTDVDGMDITAGYERQMGPLRARTKLNGTYLFTFRDTLAPGTVPVDVLSTLDNPVNFRARLVQSFSARRWDFGGALNYVNHYEDPTGAVPVAIASWTTVDLHVSYRLPWGSESATSAKVLLSCVNCFNRDPPSVATASDYFGYDPANANALDRFVSATLDVKW